MAASTGVFNHFRSVDHDMNAMTKESACIVDSFFEFAEAGVRVMRNLKQQRMSAFFADVLMVVCPCGNRDVLMLAEKTGQRMGDV